LKVFKPIPNRRDRFYFFIEGIIYGTSNASARQLKPELTQQSWVLNNIKNYDTRNREVPIGDYRMRKNTMRISIAVSALSLLFFCVKTTSADPQGQAYVKGSIILKIRQHKMGDLKDLNVKFKLSRTSALLNPLEDTFKLDQVKRKFKQRDHRAKNKERPNALSDILVLQVPDNTDIEKACAEYEKNPAVIFCQPNYYLTSQSISFIPDDPYYSSFGSWGQNYDDLWHLRKINLIDNNNVLSAWDISQGENVLVGVIDSGIDILHPDLSANIWINQDEIPGNNIDDDNNDHKDDVHGWNFFADNNNTDDTLGHGTQLAGIIAAEGNNGLGTIGIAPRSKVIPIKFDSLEQSEITTLRLYKSIIYAYVNGADVINLSWSPKVPTPSIPLIENTIKTVHNLGVVFVVAAGNAGGDVADYSPANLSETITVSATDINDTIVDFSKFVLNFPPAALGLIAPNHGEMVDVTAPGSDVVSLNANGGNNNIAVGVAPASVIDSNLIRTGGTSISTAIVSGMAALLLSHNPNLSPDDVKQIIMHSADDIGEPGFDLATGHGRINVLHALQMTSVPKVKITEPSSNANVNTNEEFIAIKGLAYGENFMEYSLSYRPINEPNNWIVLDEHLTSPVSAPDSSLLPQEWDVRNLGPGRYYLKLTLTTTNGEKFEDKVMINVVSINRAPRFLDSIDLQTVTENETVIFDMFTTDPDPSDHLTITSNNLPAGSTLSDHGNVSATFTWKPDYGQGGLAYPIQFKVSDPSGASATTGTVVTVLEAPNVPPTIDPIANVTINENQHIDIVMHATNADHDPLNFTFTGMPLGASFNSATQTLSWTPSYTQSGVYPIKVTVSDGVDSVSTTFTITVLNVNRAPVLSPIGNKTAIVKQLLQFTVTASDPDASSTLTLKATGLPNGATFTDNKNGTGVFKWTATSQDRKLNVNVTFTVTDQGNLSASELVHIDIVNNGGK